MKKLRAALSLALVSALLLTSLALADQVVNTIDTTVDPALEQRTITAGGSTIVGFYIKAENNIPQGDINKCNVDSSFPATVFFNIPAGVTASSSSLTFTACDSVQNVTFSSNTVGTYDIKVSNVTGGKSGSLWDTSAASFRLIVTAPPDTTPPIITYALIGTLGNNGWYTTNVLVDWTVVDPESTFTTIGCVDTTVNYDTSGVTLSCQATSAGSTRSASVTIKRDATAPAVTISPNRPPDYNGWYNTAIAFAVSGSDAISGIASCDSNFYYSAPDSATAQVSASCHDHAGNVGSAMYSFKYDDTLPEISFLVTPAPADTGWYNLTTGAPTVAYVCSDATSGVVSCTPAYMFPEGSVQSHTGTAVDNAGNSASATVSGINVDLTPPTITFVGPDTAVWHTADVTATWTCSDDLSGVVSPVVSVMTSGEGDAVAVTGVCMDIAGNTASDTRYFKIDKTAPMITFDGPDPSVWYNADVTARWTCSDDLSGMVSGSVSGVASGEGNAVAVSGVCQDKAGNTASDTQYFQIDKTAPFMFASLSPVRPASGWWNLSSGAPTVSFTCMDGLSGIAVCPANYTFGEGMDQTYAGTALDNAGNASVADVEDVDVDLTPPTILWSNGPLPGGVYYFGAVPAAPTCTAVDALSGPGSCTVTGYSATIGTHTLVATAFDQAGNTQVETRTYTVKAWTLKGFYQPVDMGGVWNTVKGGSTVPLKFEIFAGATELTDVSAVYSITSAQVACTAGLEETVEEVTATGGTVLRYDPIAGQFIFNWQTLRKPGTCHRVTLTARDGSTLVAFFKLK